jgi:NAD(P)-dependent dehydrogenase (short-subunit alcohol dehydrogenase family)
MPHDKFIESNDFAGRTALVTGGAQGLGKAIAEVLLKRGARVIIADIKEDILESAKAELEKVAPNQVTSEILDVRNQESIDVVFDNAEADDSVVDVLINNAGICRAYPFIDGDTGQYEEVFDVNVKGLLNISRTFAQRLAKVKKSGNIVNLSSNAGKRPYEHFIEYNASKAAVANITHGLSQEFAPFDINVNGVAPGAADTDMLLYSIESTLEITQDEATVEDCRASWGPKQIGRLVEPIEVARVVAFLASADAHIVRGQTLHVDGGDTAL